MTPSWKDLANAISFVLLFGIMGFSLYQGNAILVSIFRGIIVFFTFKIINIIFTSITTKLLNDFEIRRLHEMQHGFDEDDHEEDIPSENREQIG
ncbi:MAG: hypothetical protein P9L92_10030 [Candidatus Electryonea clarkiae]|nr:hypothetical protein [Candidatus Electryonea clarkiae]MDP8288058.1 hypothetical protein [Candidatus Electryonea clarkiae]